MEQMEAKMKRRKRVEALEKAKKLEQVETKIPASSATGKAEALLR